MRAFGHAHWQTRYDQASARLEIDGQRLVCRVGSAQVEGDADAPLWFISAAWALIRANQGADDDGHIVAGQINRIWPLGPDRKPNDPQLGDALQAFAAYWPDLYYSRLLYGDLQRADQSTQLALLETAPARTSMLGILKRVLPAAFDAEPLQRLRLAEFLYSTLDWNWGSTGADQLMNIFGKALKALLADPVPAVRETAMIAADLLAEGLWSRRAYDHYPALSRTLAGAGLNAHLHYARLAEAALVAGDWAAADAYWANVAGRQLGSAFSGLGDWGNVWLYIHRKAAEAHLIRAQGGDPDGVRQQQLEKHGLKPPEAETRDTHLVRAGAVFDRVRFWLDVCVDGEHGPSASGKAKRLQDGSHSRLFLDELSWLESNLMYMRGDADAGLRKRIAAVNIEWQMAGASADFYSRYQDQLLPLADGSTREQLQALGWPEFLWPAWQQRQADLALRDDDGEAAREAFFWRDFLLQVATCFIGEADQDLNPITLEPLLGGFVVERVGAMLRIRHASHDDVVEASLAAPVLAALRAWSALWRRQFSTRPQLDTWSGNRIFIDDDGVAVAATLAQAAWQAGERVQAAHWWRIAHGLDPLITLGGCHHRAMSRLLDRVPLELHDSLDGRNLLPDEPERRKLKPAGRRVEALAALLDGEDWMLAREIGDALRSECACDEPALSRLMKSAPALLLQLRGHAHPAVQEMGLIASLVLLSTLGAHRQWPLADGQLIAAIEQTGIDVYRR
ncbi:MAG: hypothetical protein Q4G62_11085 [Pseudomonadota bacterium]|nr:hypothetical protein [Pseudomonadota bacterium]